MGRLILYCGSISSCHYLTKTPLFLSLCTYVGCVARCHDNSPLLHAYLGLALCLLTGARQPRGLHRCSPMTVWWSFIANSSVSKSLLLSSLFWFMYSLIYLCMWTMGTEERRGGEGAGGKKGRRQQLQYMLLSPRERLRYICLLKAPAQTGTAQKQTTTKPPHVNRNTVHVLFTQTENGFFQLHAGSMKRVKRCCSPLWELQKEKKKKRKAVCYCRFRILHRQQWSQCCGGLCTPFVRLSSAFAHLWMQQRKASQRPVSTGTEEQSHLKVSCMDSSEGQWGLTTHRHVFHQDESYLSVSKVPEQRVELVLELADDTLSELIFFF